jgi:hypothetical protein
VYIFQGYNTVGIVLGHGSQIYGIGFDIKFYLVFLAEQILPRVFATRSRQRGLSVVVHLFSFCSTLSNADHISALTFQLPTAFFGLDLQL